jgi:hypothetical protein
MAEVRTDSLPPGGILYSARQLESYAHPLSRLKAVEPGDLCCSCGRDCDGVGFANSSTSAVAVRIHGHPLCARASCYLARWDEFRGGRNGCGCGIR